MEKEEFISHLNDLIPVPSAKANEKLVELGDALWLEMKDDLYHAFSFVSRHFTPETLQSVYDLYGARRAGLLPWEIIGAAIYSQTGTPPETISTDEMRAFVLLPEPETAGMVSTLAACTVRENGQEKQFYTLHFGQFEPQALLNAAVAGAVNAEITVTEALQRLDYDIRKPQSHVTANKALCGPGSAMAEKLSMLLPSSPIAAAHIMIDVDKRTTTVEMNPLWEQLRDEQGDIPRPQHQAPLKQKGASTHQKEDCR